MRWWRNWKCFDLWILWCQFWSQQVFYVFSIYFASLEPMNISCQIKILRNPISARLIAHSFFRVWLNLGCSTKHFSMNMFPQSRMTRCGKQRSDVAFCRSLPRGEFLCEALHHWSATANQEMPLVMIFDLLIFWSLILMRENYSGFNYDKKTRLISCSTWLQLKCYFN